MPTLLVLRLEALTLQADNKTIWIPLPKEKDVQETIVHTELLFNTFTGKKMQELHLAQLDLKKLFNRVSQCQKKTEDYF